MTASTNSATLTGSVADSGVDAHELGGAVLIEVRIPTMMRADVAGSSYVNVSGSTIGEVIDNLVLEYPTLGSKVLASDSSLHKFINVYLNDEDVRYLDKLETLVSSGDVVSLLPAVAGGQ